jgi:hypothetical protein
MLALPPPPPAIVLVVQQDAQLPLRIPESDLVVEVVGKLPVRAKLEDVSRLLGRRQMVPSPNRAYPPTILEMITLVKPNPAKPIGRHWNSIRSMTMAYDPETRLVKVEYCLDNCTADPKTGMPHPRQKMISYSAPEDDVIKRLDKKLGELKKYSPSPPERDR